MTRYADATPADLKISKKFWLSNDSKNDPSYEPYQPAIEQLKNLSEHYTILSKLECLGESGFKNCFKYFKTHLIYVPQISDV